MCSAVTVTLLEQEITERPGGRVQGALVRCPPKMVAGQPAFESPRMCNSVHLWHAFNLLDPTHLIGLELYYGRPAQGGSPHLHNGAIDLSLQPFFSGWTPTCPDPRNTGLSTFPLPQSVWGVVNKSFPSVP